MYVAFQRVFLMSSMVQVALHLTVVTNTIAPSGVAALERDARVAWVVSIVVTAHETTAVPGSSNNDR